jgi:peptide/nickel transport system ATP-binding protein
LASRAGHAAQKGNRLVAIPGAPPDLANLPPGCAFAPRCSEVGERCRQIVPGQVYTDATHFACCLKAAAAQVEPARAIA